MCVCEHMTWHTCGAQRTHCKSSFYPSAMWVMGVKFESLGLAAGSFTCWPVSPSLPTLKDKVPSSWPQTCYVAMKKVTSSS